MPGDYTRCPFSYSLFLGTAALFVYLSESKKRSVKAEAKPELPVCEVVFVLGGPGAGKGTQCGLLQERLDGWVHLSAGDLLRAERKAGGELGDLINARIAAGALVPSSITCKLLENGMVKAFEEAGSTKFLSKLSPSASAFIYTMRMATYPHGTIHFANTRSKTLRH